MSDAQTDIARDQAKYEASAKYEELKSIYLSNPTQYNYDVLMQQAQRIDKMPRGYFTEETNVVSIVKNIRCHR